MSTRRQSPYRHRRQTGNRAHRRTGCDSFDCGYESFDPNFQHSQNARLRRKRAFSFVRTPN